MDEDTVVEFREQAPVEGDESPVVVRQTGEDRHAVVRNEVRGHVSGSVVQIAGNHYGGLSL